MECDQGLSAIEIINLKQAPEYLQQLAEWHQQEWSALNPGQGLQDRLEKMRAYLNEAFIPSTFLIRNDRLLGSAAIVEYDMDDRHDLSPWLASVYVAIDERQQGLGSQLVHHVMLEAKKAGIKKIYLFTPDQQAFYRRLGWELMEETVYHKHAVSIMVADLAQD